MKISVPVLMIVVFLAGCNNFPQANKPDCDKLTFSALRPYIEIGTSPEDTTQWIASTYQLDPASIESVNGDGGASFNWSQGGSNFAFHAFADGHSIAAVDFDRSRMTLDQLISCLGPPEQYRANYFFHPPGVNSLVFELYYPAQGLEATYVYQTTNLKRRQPPSITANTPIERIRVHRSGTFEEFVRRTSASSELAEMIISETKPWPGSLDQIEIDLGPFLESN